MNENIGNSGSGGCISPFGVKLKCTPGGYSVLSPCAVAAEKKDNVIVIHKRLDEDAAAEQKLSHQRCKLRKVPGPSPSIVQRQRRAAMVERKPSVKTYTRPGGSNEPFTLLQDKVPVFGVVLRSIQRSQQQNGDNNKEEEREEYLDLDFGNNRSSSTLTNAKDKEEEGSMYPFGVRLKPMRQHPHAEHHPTGVHTTCRAYQIDLSPPPPSKCNNNTYRNEQPRSLLEIKLRPVGNDNTGNSSNLKNDQQLVELQLRHVVAPEDGGPKRVTQALLLVPLKKVPNPSDRGVNCSTSQLQDLLQLAIHSSSSLSSSRQQQRINNADDFIPEFLQIRLRHIDPETRQIHDASQVIDLRLNHNNNKANNTTTPSLSMQVTLRHVERISRVIPKWVPEFVNIQLKSVVHCQDKHIDNDNDHDGDEEEATEYEEVEVDDDKVEEVQVVEKDNAIEERATEQQVANNEAVEEAGKQKDKKETKEMEDARQATAAKTIRFAEPETNGNASRQAAKEVKERLRKQAEEDAQKAREEQARLAEEKRLRDDAECRRLQHEIDTLKREAEEWERNKKLKEGVRLEQERQAKEQADRELEIKKQERRGKIKLRRELSVVEKKMILERRDGAYLYWQKLNRQPKQHFKDTIHLLGNTGITNQDIDTLPWMLGDSFVDIRLMNEAAVTGEGFWGTIEEKLFESENTSSL